MAQTTHMWRRTSVLRLRRAELKFCSTTPDSGRTTSALPSNAPVLRRSIAWIITGILLVPGTTWAQARSTPASDPRVADGERALARGDVAKALELANAAIAARPAGTAARLLAARAYVEREEFEAAWRELDKVLAAAPRSTDALALMGLVSGRLAGATFERLTVVAPESARVKQLQAEAFEAQDRRSEAEAAYEAALAVQPDLLDALLALGRLKRMRLACEEAVQLYERAEKVRPTYDGAYGLGFCLAYMQEDAAAVAQYERAVKRDPTAAVAWQGLGTALVKVGRRTEGIAALTRAVTIEPKMTDGWYMLGMAYQGGGDTVRAKEAFDKAEALRAGDRR